MTDDPMLEIRPLGPADAALFGRVAPDLFDKPIQPALVREFLDDPRHHCVAAIDAGALVGFISAVRYVHPDKPAELWLNEVAVAPTHRNRGVARAMLRETLALGERLGCHEAWVLTDRGNAPAMRAYAAAGGEEAPVPSVMFTFRLPPASGGA